MKAGKLRQRVSFDIPVREQDPTTGEITVSWKVKYADVPASVEPLSVREYLLSQQLNSIISAKICVRAHPDGFSPDMRIRHGSTIYSPQGFLADKESGNEYITIPCSTGANEGE